MTDEIKEKVGKLPVWARDYISRLELQGEPQLNEITQLRRKVQHLEGIIRAQKDRIGAMVAMFQCAAKGGNEVATAVQKIVEEYVTVGEE
jgi:hypothetical protein